MLLVTVLWLQWQTCIDYYEHVIRDEEALDRIRRYILDNPARWIFDRENPAATTLEREDAWRDCESRWFRLLSDAQHKVRN